MSINIKGRSFLKLLDFSSAEIQYLLKLSKHFKSLKMAGMPHRSLEGKNIVLLFEKPQHAHVVPLKLRVMI